ncbi:MAG: ParB/RepB/Spo0J family partition protein [Acidobacteriota bacterium]|nr:MAG: ParB/RepB/Spo0J family partition protein [Acidobacteriota bacterium]
MSKQRGLPPSHRMRADTHFVDQITAGRPATIGRLISIELLEPNPDQPRREHQGVEELAESIREKGILEPMLVRPMGGGRFQIIAGERRYRAACHVGLTQVPCIELDVDDRGCLEISLIENLQRKDLTAFEEAEAISRLCDEFAYTHEQVARKLGKSRTSITELLSLTRMPESVKVACRRADITSKSTLMEIVRQRSEAAMLALVRQIAEEELTRDEVRERKREGRRPERDAGEPRPYVFHYRPANREFALSLRFQQEVVEPRELLSVLREIVRDLEQQIDTGGDD